MSVMQDYSHARVIPLNDSPRARWTRRHRAARLAHHQDVYAEMPFAALLFSLAVWAVLVYAGWLVLWVVF